MKTKYTSCKRCFDVFLAMLRSRRMIVQCEAWGEKTKQGWGWDWALRNSQPTIFARLPMLLSWRDCRRIFLVLTAAIIQTNARKKAVVTQKRHWRQKRATAIKRPRNLHMIKRIEPFKSGISTLNGKTLFLGLFTMMAKCFVQPALIFQRNQVMHPVLYAAAVISEWNLWEVMRSQQDTCGQKRLFVSKQTLEMHL